VTQGLDQPVAEPDAPQAIHQPTLTHEIEGGDPAAEPLEGAPAERGVGVHRLVERADEQHAVVLQMFHRGSN
jgi:hypothetical protein